MLSITKMISKYNHYKYNDIKYIVLHDTGNYKDTAKNNALYFNGGNRGSSAHYFVDDTSIYQVVEDSHGSWHCGDGGGKNGITNTNSIGIEMCNSGGYISDKTIQNTLDLVRFLMNKYSVPINKVVRHYDASGKICPNNMSKNNWALWKEFKDKLTNKTNSNSYIKLDGGGTILEGKPAINLIIRDFSKNIERVFGYVDNDSWASWAFDVNPPNDNYTKLEKNCSKVINKRTNSNVFTEGATYKVIVKGYSKGVEVCKNTIAITVPKTGNKLYRVQVGAFKDKNNAKELQENLKKHGFDGFIKE